MNRNKSLSDEIEEKLARKADLDIVKDWIKDLKDNWPKLDFDFE